MKRTKAFLAGISLLAAAYMPLGVSAQMVLDGRNNVVLNSSVLAVAADLQTKIDKNLRDLWGQVNAIERGCNLTPPSASGSVSAAPADQTGSAMQLRFAQIIAELQSNVNELTIICPQTAPFSTLDFTQVPTVPTPTPAPTPPVAPTMPAVPTVPTTSISTINLANLSANNVTIRWTTDESRGGVVYYGTTSPVNTETGPAVTSRDFGKEHAVDLVGLTPDTIYYFVIFSSDSTGKSVKSAEQSFRTLAIGAPIITPTPSAPAPSVLPFEPAPTTDFSPPALSSIQAAPGPTWATIFWSTDELANSQVYYSTMPGVDLTGDPNVLLVMDTTMTTSHSVMLPNLTPNTTYYYVIKSRDGSNNSSMSEELTFMTVSQ